MKELSKFANVAGTISDLPNQLDPNGSSQDVIFAEAIVAMEPTSILEEAGIIAVQQTPDPHDELAFPIVRNTQLTWYTIDGRTGSNSGSELDTTGMNAVEYKKVRPTTKTASIFLPDEVSLLNKVSFDLYTEMCARDAKRKKESDALTTLTTEANLLAANLYAAGGFTANGSVDSGSTLDPSDLLSAQRLLGTGSDPVRADFVLMHNNQYEQFNKHADYAPGATSPGAMMRRTQFDSFGNIINFAGMDVFVTELMPSVTGSATTAYESTGHPVIVGKKGIAIGRGEKIGMRVSTQDDRLKHGTYKVIDMSYDHTVLVQESIVLLRTAD